MPPTIRRTLFIMLMAAVALYAVVHLSGPNGLSALMQKRQAVSAMEDANRELEAKVAERTQYVEDIKAKKPEVVIPLIRNRTNWVRDGEKDFRFEKKQRPEQAKPSRR